jgi:DNA glycosylase AlkZ-like
VTERVLKQRELNRALLARQLLLERRRLSLPRALEHIGGIQNQYAPNAYIRLWSCLDGFERDALDRALARRSVVQATLMRGTIHVVSARDFWPFAVGIRRAGRQWWLRVRKPHAELVDLDAAAAALRDFVRGTTRTRDELVRRLNVFDPPGAPANLAWSGVDVDLVRAPPSGTWAKRRAHTFALAEDWLGPPDADEDAGLERLARRYLAAFGPATRNELADWAGVPVTVFKDVLARMPLRRFAAEDGSELLDVPRAPLPDAETPAPIRFLPTWDAALLVHARRTGILPEAYRPRIFNTKAPQSFGTFLIDGAVAGTWRFDGGRVLTEPFQQLSREPRAELRDEAERLAAFHA